MLWIFVFVQQLSKPGRALFYVLRAGRAWNVVPQQIARITPPAHRGCGQKKGSGTNSAEHPLGHLAIGS